MYFLIITILSPLFNLIRLFASLVSIPSPAGLDFKPLLFLFSCDRPIALWIKILPFQYSYSLLNSNVESPVL